MRGSLQALRIAAVAFLLAIAASSAEALGLTKNADLAFGDLSVSGVTGMGSTVTITPSGTRSSVGSVTLLTSTYGAASFSVTFSNINHAYSIILPTSATLTSGGGFTMSVDTFTSSGSASSSFTVGATLRVASTQMPGTYMGTFLVTVTQP